MAIPRPLLLGFRPDLRSRAGPLHLPDLPPAHPGPPHGRRPHRRDRARRGCAGGTRTFRRSAGRAIARRHAGSWRDDAAIPDRSGRPRPPFPEGTGPIANAPAYPPCSVRQGVYSTPELGEPHDDVPSAEDRTRPAGARRAPPWLDCPRSRIARPSRSAPPGRDLACRFSVGRGRSSAEPRAFLPRFAGSSARSLGQRPRFTRSRVPRGRLGPACDRRGRAQGARRPVPERRPPYGRSGRWRSGRTEVHDESGPDGSRRPRALLERGLRLQHDELRGGPLSEQLLRVQSRVRGLRRGTELDDLRSGYRRDQHFVPGV